MLFRSRPDTITFADIWPQLGGVITWTGGSCGSALNALANQWSTQTHFMEAGYVSSEFWGSITSITGEKLSENQIARAVEIAQRNRGISIPFFIALADEVASRYRLYVEVQSPRSSTLAAIESSIDSTLAEINIEYRDKRASGCLLPLKVFMLQPGSGDLHRKDCVGRGQSDAQFKAMLLQYRGQCRFDFDRQCLQAQYA